MAAMPPFFTGRSFFRDAELPPVSNPNDPPLLNFTSSFDPSRTMLGNNSSLISNRATGAERRYYLIHVPEPIQNLVWSVLQTASRAMLPSGQNYSSTNENNIENVVRRCRYPRHGCEQPDVPGSAI